MGADARPSPPRCVQWWLRRGTAAPGLPERAYRQLCARSGTRPNKGVLRCLSAPCEPGAGDGVAAARLDLSDAHLGAAGLRDVVALLRCSPRLRFLGLAQQQIDADGLAPLCAAVAGSRGLLRLVLDRNPLSISAARRLADLSRNTRTLEEVQLDGTEVTGEWRARIAARLRDNELARTLGLVSAPVLRPPGSCRVVRCLVAAPSAAGFAAELDALHRDVFPELNRALHPRGVALLPVALQWGGGGGAAEGGAEPGLWGEAVARCRDGVNHDLPWAVFLCAAKGATPADPTPGADAAVDGDMTPAGGEGTGLSAAVAACLDAVGAVPPLPPLVDKNGHRRGPLRPQAPSVVVLSRTAARGGGAPAGRIGAELRRHRLCASADYSAADLPDVFAATAASHLLLSLDIAYPPGSGEGSPRRVARCAAAHFPTAALREEEVYGLGPGQAVAEWENPALQTEAAWEGADARRQWLHADGLLAGYEPRPALEAELMGHCDRYAPESGGAFPLIVYGQEGVGKSALLARVAADLRRARPPADADAPAVVLLFAGADGVDSLADALRHLRRRVRAAAGLPPAPAVDAEPDAVQLADWRRLLAAPRARKVVVLLAGLDRIPGGAGLVPRSLPRNVRVVAACATEGELLGELRGRRPQPYELLVAQMPRRPALTLLRRLLPGPLPGVGEEEAAGGRDEGVIAEPRNAADAMCFKDHCGLPCYLQLAAQLLAPPGAPPHADEAAVFAAVRAMPEDIGSALCALLDRWGAELGHDAVRHLFGALALPEYELRGLTPAELTGALRAEGGPVEWAHPEQAATLDALLLRARGVTCVTADGAVRLRHPALAAAARRRYGVAAAAAAEPYHSALALHHLAALHGGGGATAYTLKRALAALPTCLVAAGRPLDAHALLGDASFLERKLQAGLFLGVLSDIALVDGALRRCVEAGLPGFVQRQQRPLPQALSLRRLRRALTDGAAVLARHPSVVQLGANLPECHALRRAADGFLASPAGEGYPVLRWANRRTRGSVADRQLRLPHLQLRHVSFAADDATLLAATAAEAVHVVRAAVGMEPRRERALAISDASAPPEGYLASHFAQDASILVTACADRVVVWDWAAAAPVRRVIADVSASLCRSLSPDAATLCAVQGSTGKGCIIHVAKGRVISTLAPHRSGGGGAEPVRELFYAAASAVVASVGASAVCVYRGTEQVCYGAHDGLVSAAALTPQGDLAASCDGAVVHLWSAVTAEPLHYLTAHAPCPVADVTFHPGGHMLTTCDGGGKLRIWQATSGEEVKTDGVDSEVGGVSWAGFMPGGGRLVARCARVLRLWETSLFQSQGVLWGHDGDVTHVALSQDQRSLASVGTDGVLMWWGADRGDYPTPSAWNDPSLILAAAPESVALRADVHGRGCVDVALRRDGGGTAACFADGALRVWGRDGGAAAASDGRAYVAARFVDGADALVAAQLSTLGTYDPARGRQVANIDAARGLVAPEESDGLRPFAATPDGRVAACCVDCADVGVSSRILLFDVPKRGRVGELRGHTAPVAGLAFADAGHVASAGADATLRLWALANLAQCGEARLPGAATCVAAAGGWAVAGLASGQLAVARADPAASPAVSEHAVFQTHQRGVTAVALFGPAAALIASAGGDFAVVVSARAGGEALAAVATVNVPTCIAARTPPPPNPKARHPAQRPARIAVGDDSGHVYLYDVLPAGLAAEPAAGRGGADIGADRRLRQQ